MNSLISIFTLIVLSLGTFLLAAKAHGRQIRLEREREGHMHVTFGKENHPFVEKLWSRDRKIYWSTAATCALIVILYWLIAAKFGWPRPFNGHIAAGIWLLWFFSMVTAFIVAG